jgi:hypothetical protein
MLKHVPVMYGTLVGYKQNLDKQIKRTGTGMFSTHIVTMYNTFVQTLKIIKNNEDPDP